MSVSKSSEKFWAGSGTPTRLYLCLAILILRTVGLTQDSVAGRLNCGKQMVGDVELWFRGLTFSEAEQLCSDVSLREKADEAISKSEEMDIDLAMKVGKTSANDILQKYRGDYLEDRAPKGELEPREARHLNELAQTAEALALRIGRLLRYGGKEYEVHGNVLDGLSFWRKASGQPVSMTIDPLSESRYDTDQETDEYLAECLLVHYEDRFGRLPFTDWREATRDNVSQVILRNLLVLSHSEHLSFCASCPSCKAIGG
jgi:hypothetical protein